LKIGVHNQIWCSRVATLNKLKVKLIAAGKIKSGGEINRAWCNRGEILVDISIFVDFMNYEVKRANFAGLV
jgi:hypothetical protein